MDRSVTERLTKIRVTRSRGLFLITVTMQRTVSILSFMYFSHVCAIFALEQFHFSADTSFNLVSRVREYELVVFLRLYFDKATVTV